MRKFSSYLALILVALLVATVVPACQQPTPEPTEAPAEEPTEPPAEEEEPGEEAEFDWRQQEGTELTVFLSETPMAVAIRENIEDFRDLTGIDIDYLVVSESEYWSKLAVDLSSGAGEYDVFMSGPSMNWGYGAAGQIQPLDPYLEDPALTPAEWGFDQFFDWAIEAQRWNGEPGPDSLGQGDLWAVPVNSVNNLLTYRKDLFDEWGLEPPDTWDEWASVSREIMNQTGGELDGQPFYAVVQRGALDTTTLSGPFYSGLFSYGGADFNPDLTPAMNNERSVAFQKLYMDTIKETGSPEWPNHMWFDVQQGFTSGQFAMVFDVDNFIPTYEGEGSEVAGKLGYALPPAGPEGDRNSYPWTWGFSMNAETESDQAEAAWLFMVWASSKERMVTFASTGSWPTRKDVWDDPEVVEFTNQFADGAFRETMDEVLNNYVEWKVTPMVEYPAVSEMWVAGLHDYYFDQGSMQEIMDDVAGDITVHLVDTGTVGD